MRDKSKISFLKINSLIKKALKFSSFLLIAFLLFSGGNVLAKTINLGTTGDSILLNGNVGIGTTAPNSILEVKAAIPVININGTSGADFKGISFQTSQSETAIIKTESNGGELRIQSGMSANWGGFQTFYTNNLERVRINSNGNVGIGTTAPGQILHLNGTNIGLQVSTTGYGGTTYASYLGSGSGSIGFLQLGNNGTNYIVGGNSAAGGKLDFIVNNSNAFPSTPNGTEAMTILANGNVGIGKTNPATALDINGIITATSFAGPMAGTLNAANVSSGTFGSNTGSGNYTFPANATVAGVVSAATGAAGGFRSTTYTAGQNLIWAFGNASTYGFSYKQGGLDDIRFHLGDFNNPQFLIRQDGNVGIGTTVPVTPLQINGAVGIYNGTSGNIGGISITPTNGDTVITNNSPGAYGDYGIRFKTMQTTGGAQYNDALYLKYNGNVGIGTTNPITKLDVKGKLQVDNSGTYSTTYSWAGGTLQTNSVEIMDRYSGSTGDGVYPTLTFHDYGNGGAQFSMEGLTTTLHLGSGQSNSAGTLAGAGSYFSKLKIWGGLEVTGTISGNLSGTATNASNADTLDGYHETGFLRLAANSSNPTNGTFAIGTASGRNFIQSHNGQPLDINPLGNAVTINGGAVITSSNIGSQSVNYAASAGSATNATNAGYATNAGGAFGMGYDGNAISGTGLATGWDSRPGVGNAAFAINWHTGVTISGYPGYGGVRLYSAGYPTQASAVLRLEASSAVYTFGGLYSDGNAVIHAGNIGSQSVSNSDMVDGQHFVWANNNNNPTYLWGADSNGISYLASRANMSVNYANSAGTAGSTGILTGNAHANGSDGWFRSNGQAGWYSESYGVGVYATQAGRVDLYNGASLYVPGTVSTPTLDASGYVYGAELYTRDNVYLGYMGNWMSNLLNQSVRTDSSPTFANPHVSDWMSFNSDSASYIGNGGIAGGWGSTANDLALRSSGSIFFATGGSTPRMKIDASGVTAGAFIYSSDRNLKKNITTIQNPLEKILQLRGVTFNWKASDKPSVGLIAQEVEKVFPELVIGEEGRKGVQYGNLVAPLIEAVKAQQKEIEELKAGQKDYDLLKTRVNKLETKSYKK